jgi:hypothetical protein
MDSTLLKYVENTEYTENLTESEKKEVKEASKTFSCASVTSAFSLSHSATFMVSSVAQTQGRA